MEFSFYNDRSENSFSTGQKAMLVHFNDLFVVAEEKVIRPKVIIKIEDLVLTPREHPPLDAVVVEGVPLQNLVEEMLEVDLEYQNVVVFIVKGVAK